MDGRSVQAGKVLDGSPVRELQRCLKVVATRQGIRWTVSCVAPPGT